MIVFGLILSTIPFSEQKAFVMFVFDFSESEFE